MCDCIHVYSWQYINSCVFLCVWIYMHVYTGIYTSTCEYACVNPKYEHLCVCMYAYMQVCVVFTCSSVCLHEMSTCMCVQVHMGLYIWHLCWSNHVCICEYMHISFTGVDMVVYYAYECSYVCVFVYMYVSKCILYESIYLFLCVYINIFMHLGLNLCIPVYVCV